MGSEREKGIREVVIFRRFLDLAQLPVDRASIEKRVPPEPDILCTHSNRGRLAFELAELCDPNIAQLVDKARTGEADAIWTADPSRRILMKKLRTNYKTAFPVELLCYTDGRIVTPDDVILPTLRPILEAWNGVFVQAWFLGEEKVHLLWGSG